MRSVICKMVAGDRKGFGMSAEFHESLRREEPVEVGSNRSFGMVFASAGLIFAGLSFWRGGHAWPWWLIASGCFALVSIACPALLAPLNRLWMRFGLILSRIMQPVIMALLFFTTVVPTGLIARVLKKDPLRLRLDDSASSYWIERTSSETAESSFKNQF
jgi:hypothetical protein